MEFGCERFDKDAECIDDNRTDSACTAQGGNQYDPPAIKDSGTGAMWRRGAHTRAELVLEERGMELVWQVYLIRAMIEMGYDTIPASN